MAPICEFNFYISEWISLVSGRYHFSTQSVSWEDARDMCSMKGASLVQIESATENEAIIQYLKARPDLRNDFWIGLSDLSSEGEWRWEKSGTLVQNGYENWIPGQPDNYGWGEEDCVEFRANYSTHPDDSWAWNEHGCFREKLSICEK